MASSSTPPLSWAAGSYLRAPPLPSPPLPYSFCAPCFCPWYHYFLWSHYGVCHLQLLLKSNHWSNPLDCPAKFAASCFFPSIPNTPNEAFITFHLDHCSGLLTSPHDSGFSMSQRQLKYWKKKKCPKCCLKSELEGAWLHPTTKHSSVAEDLSWPPNTCAMWFCLYLSPLPVLTVLLGILWCF